MGSCSDEIDVYAVLAYVGSFMLAMGPMYQTYKMQKNKHTKDISMKWSLNYLVALIFTILFSSANEIWPILFGAIIEFINMLILVGYKVYVEKKFLRFKFGKKHVEIVEITKDAFKMIATANNITMSTEHENIDDFIQKSNNNDNIFIIKYTRDDIHEMMNAMDVSTSPDYDFKELNINLHDNDNEDNIA
jgi:uncharacterized protein with PQ loop repeat